METYNAIPQSDLALVITLTFVKLIQFRVNHSFSICNKKISAKRRIQI